MAPRLRPECLPLYSLRGWKLKPREGKEGVQNPIASGKTQTPKTGIWNSRLDSSPVQSSLLLLVPLRTCDRSAHLLRGRRKGGQPEPTGARLLGLGYNEWLMPEV